MKWKNTVLNICFDLHKETFFSNKKNIHILKIIYLFKIK